MTLTQANRLMRVSTPLGEDVLVLREMTAEEHLSQPFEFTLELLSTNGNIKLEDLLGKYITVELTTQNGGTRYFNGVVSKFALTGAHGGFVAYRAVVRPWLWLLTRTSDCRIFQEMTVPDIVATVFRDLGFTDFDNRLMGDYRKRDYCCQYNETTFDFVSRLLEQEGIYYYFSHDNGKHTLVLADSISGHDLVPGYEEIPYFPPQAQQRRERDHIYAWSLEREVQSGAYAHNDFDFEKASADLNTKLVAPANHAHADFETYHYPGEYHEKSDGDHYARVRLETLQAQHEHLVADGNARGLGIGNLFRLTGSGRDDQNREYLITGAEYTLISDRYESATDTGDEPLYTCRLHAIASQHPYRHPCDTPKPVVPGPQTAIVVGKSGEELWTDQYGRVKVQFHWDRQGKKDENSSCWVRVAQSWAGNGWGSIHIPRIGQEVIVEFLDGDPDRPIITGRVYNNDTPVPYGLPTNATQSGIKSRSSKGGGASNYNELRFEDKKGSEHIHLQAEKDYTRVVKNNEEAEIQANHSVVIKGDHTMTITNASRHEAKTILITAADSIELKVGGSTIKMSPSSIDIDSTQINISGSAAVALKGGVVKLN